MSITEIPVLDRTSATFKADLNTLFGSTIPTFSTELNTEITRLNTLGAGSYSGTSTTSLAIGTGDKALTVGTGKGFVTGQYVSVADSANAANYMRGPVKSYNSGTGALVVSVDSIGGSGTKTAWSVGLIAVSDAAIQLYSLVELTSGTSWTCPAGVRKVKITMAAGGGSGATGSTTSYIGTDGAGGGGLIAVIPVTAGQSYAYTIGAGGAAVGGTGANGNAGSSSTFTANGVTYTATGGEGGVGAGARRAVGGSGTGTGAVIIPGDAGLLAQAVSQTTSSLGGGGGKSILGPSGSPGGIGGGTSIAGLPGKIILELHK